MKKVILFGASGNLGTAITKELQQQKFFVTAVIRNKNTIPPISSFINKHILADVTKRETLSGICDGYDVVISALGKSVSPFERSKQTFREIDLEGNISILAESQKSGVKKFVYVSAFHSERFQHLEYFKVHHLFSEELKRSGINYSIIKPPALFSAFVEMFDLARKGMLTSIGNGEKKTNPIYEGDVAKICVDSISKTNVIIEAGGKNIYTRKQLLEIIQQKTNPGKKLRTVPISLVKFFLPVIKVSDNNLFDKMAFFLEVLKHDVIAPQHGAMTFEEYIEMKLHT